MGQYLLYQALPGLQLCSNPAVAECTVAAATHGQPQMVCDAALGMLARDNMKVSCSRWMASRSRRSLCSRATGRRVPRYPWRFPARAAARAALPQRLRLRCGLARQSEQFSTQCVCSLHLHLIRSVTPCLAICAIMATAFATDNVSLCDIGAACNALGNCLAGPSWSLVSNGGRAPSKRRNSFSDPSGSECSGDRSCFSRGGCWRWKSSSGWQKNAVG